MRTLFTFLSKKNLIILQLIATNSITGSLDSRLPAFAINASAILPSRCAFLPFCFSKISKKKIQMKFLFAIPIYSVSGSSKLVVTLLKMQASSSFQV
jgi:hypothetical protein